MVSLFFSLLKLHLKKKKHQNIHLFSLSRSTSPTKFHDNQWKKKQAFGCLFVAATHEVVAGQLCMVFVADTGGACPKGSEICLPNGDESRTKIPNLVERTKDLEPW